MGDYELSTYPDPQALAEAAARDWLSQVGAATRPGARYGVALSGGRIAGRFMAAVAAQAKARGVTFEAVHFFWSDERCVPPTSPESNFGLARDTLLEPLGIPAANIHRLRGEEPPEVAAAQGEAELRQFAARNAEGQPVLDLVFLGLGEDGHVASLFPGEPEAVRASQAVFRPVFSPKPPPQRLTMGYPALGAAREVWVLASGAGKERPLKESLAPAGQTSLARVLRLREHTRIFTDLLPG
jgi:6-phosphogluconolactonase